MAYFDNAATTYPKPEVVYTSMDKFYRLNGANAGRGRYNLAQSANALIGETRALVQELLHCPAKQAVSYKRAVGFFSSSSLIEISKGIADLASHGGRIQIVASPYLSDDDIEAIKKGYADRNEVIEAALLGQLSDEHTDYYSMERLNLLANLIANGVLDIRIAYTEDAKGIGMYHEKMGIIEDADGNKVAFSGSMNGWSICKGLSF